MTHNTYECVCVFPTLCAGMRLMRIVSSSSCVTPSPSMMMELIRSIMCICTFWLWLLLWRERKGDKDIMIKCDLMEQGKKISKIDKTQIKVSKNL